MFSAALHRARLHAQTGFSLIELLIVVLIIGILATIMIPRFITQRDSANNAKAKSVLRNAATAAEGYYQQNEYYGESATGTSPNAVASYICTAEAGGIKIVDEGSTSTTAASWCSSPSNVAIACSGTINTGANTVNTSICNPGKRAQPENVFILGNPTAGKTGQLVLCNASRGDRAYCIKLRGNGSLQFSSSTVGVDGDGASGAATATFGSSW